MEIHRRKFLHLTASAAAISAASRIASADSYPSRPIRLIVGFTAGAASDVIARIFARGAGPVVGQQIIVENKPGAGSSIAAQDVARAPKDGYTLFLPALSTLTNEIVNPSSPPLDISKDFAPIAQLAEGPFFLTINPALGVHSVADLVALAKSKPGELTFGSVGSGSLPHLCGVLFEQQADIKLVHVPYPGSPETVTDLIAGRITLFDHRTDQRGPTHGVGNDRRSTRQPVAQRANHNGGRYFGFRRQPLARVACACRYAAANHRHACRCRA